MRDEFGLEGKVAVVTGAAQGIGKGIAAAFAAHGAAVVIADIDDERGSAATSEIGSSATYKHCDISLEDDVKALVTHVEAELDHIDILVNNAGYSRVDPRERVTIDRYPVDAWRRKVDVDLTGTFYCSRVVSEHMVRRKTGCIINIASIAGVVALRNQVAHDAAKAGIIKMTEAMALELGPKGIRVNAISPGSTLTQATEKLFYGKDAIAKERAEQLLSFIPLGRPGRIQDIAGAALYLASDLASYVTGHNLVVDGGWTAGFNRNF